MTSERHPRLLVVAASAALIDALAAHCPREHMVVLPDAAAALAHLHAQPASLPRLMVVEDSATAAALIATIVTLKNDPHAGLVPLVVVGGAIDLAACYGAGANACVLRPAAPAALREAAGALVNFWLAANEMPPAGA